MSYFHKYRFFNKIEGDTDADMRSDPHCREYLWLHLGGGLDGDEGLVARLRLAPVLELAVLRPGRWADAPLNSLGTASPDYRLNPRC